jgi:hypothetical protein
MNLGGVLGWQRQQRLMRQRGPRLVTVLIVGLAIGVATSCGSSSTDTAAGPAVAAADTNNGGAVLTLVFDGGELQGGVRREQVGLGDSVTLIVDGAVDDVVHVHGYDLYLDPTVESSIVFDALIPGRFEVELEGSGLLLVELTVS